MNFVGDPIREVQPRVADFLRMECSPSGPILLDAEVREDIGWRPHLFEERGHRAWHIHLSLPETDSWFKRMTRARAADPTLRVGLIAPPDVFLDEEFILLSDKLEAAIIRLPTPEPVHDQQLRIYASIADFVIETRAQLSNSASKALLDELLARALEHDDSHRRGVLFEILVGVLLSQVRGFEVHDVGISNRSQQMDVLIQNRNTGGVLSGSPIVLAEAKNWKDPVTTTEYAEFVRKMQSRHSRSKLGFLVTTSRFTEGVVLERRRESAGDYLVVLIDGTALVGTWRSADAITDRIERLVMDATIGS